jgi:hypothetical protein
MHSIKILLEELDQILQEHNQDNYKKLKVSLPDTEINYYLKKLGINDQNFELFFEWRNGNDINEISNQHCQIFDFGSIISLESIVKLTITNTKKELNSWKSSFTPVIANGEGDFLLYNNDEKQDDYGKLHLFSASLLFIEEPISYYDSLETLIKTTIEAYKQSIFRYDPKRKWLNMDLDRYFEIAKVINNKSKYWKSLRN